MAHTHFDKITQVLLGAGFLLAATPKSRVGEMGIQYVNDRLSRLGDVSPIFEDLFAMQFWAVEDCRDGYRGREKISIQVGLISVPVHPGDRYGLVDLYVASARPRS